MDVEKLIRRLRNDADAYRNGETLGRAFADQEDVLDNAATALSTLQAENEKLRAEVESLKKGYCAGCSIPAVKAEQIRDLTDAHKLRAELEQVKRDLDAAVKDMEALMWFSGEGCHICAHEIVIHKEPYVRSECALGNGAACCPTWRGQKEE